MKLRRPSELKTQDRALAAWATDVLRAVRELQDLPFMAGRLLENVVLSTTETKVNHGLGRPARGFWVVNPTTQETVFHSAAPDDKNLYLTASGDTEVDVWVF